jgi:hypothetical protein
VLAGGHCVPANLPQPARFVWHKLYASTQRHSDTAKARKDLRQAAVLAAVLAESEEGALEEAAAEASQKLLQAAKARLPQVRELLEAHPAAVEQLELVLEHL